MGGYAVAHHGHPRTTADMDIWIAIHPDNARRLVDVFNAFGMKSPDITLELFMARVSYAVLTIERRRQAQL